MIVKINGNEYEALNDYYITEQTGNKTASFFSILVESQPVPVAGDIIEVFDYLGNTFFWGVCGIPKSPKYSTGLETQIYTITCNNANSILANRVINVAYQNYTVSQIIENLYAQYIGVENIEIGEISNISVNVDVYTASNFNLQTALNELSDLVGATWRVDNDRKFYFIAENDFPQFPQQINESFLLGAEMQETTKDYQTRTVQYITGATDTTSPQSEIYSYDGEQKSFVTVFPLAQKPAMFVNNVQVSPNRIGVNGIDNDAANIVFLFSYNSQTITIKDDSYLATGDTVTINYVGLFPIRVVAKNQSKISEISSLTGTSGLREKVYLATDVKTTQDALQLANSLLSQFSSATSELVFWLTSAQLERLGMTLHDTAILTQIDFNLPTIHISGKYVIVERKISSFSSDSSVFKIELMLRDRNYLKSYAETISNLYRDVNQLSIRQDDTVIQQNYIDENNGLTENITESLDFPMYCAANVINGSLFSGFTFGNGYYPTERAKNWSGEYTGDSAHYSVNLSSAAIFAPLELGNVYPVLLTGKKSIVNYCVSAIINGQLFSGFTFDGFYYPSTL